MARILMVDDDELLLQVTGDYLESRGHAVFRCVDSTRAVELAEKTEPELAIVDFEMPHLNGTHLLTELRLARGARALPVIFLSGADALGYASQVPSDPSIRFLHKPADFDQLDGAITDLLGPGSPPNKA